jgi:sec-independent protein translocase protein TatA
MLDFGPPELLIVLAIVIVLFGAGRLADIGRGLGRGIREFRKELRSGDDEPESQTTTKDFERG